MRYHATWRYCSCIKPSISLRQNNHLLCAAPQGLDAATTIIKSQSKGTRFQFKTGWTVTLQRELLVRYLRSNYWQNQFDDRCSAANRAQKSGALVISWVSFSLSLRNRNITGGFFFFKPIFWCSYVLNVSLKIFSSGDSLLCIFFMSKQYRKSNWILFMNT